MVGSIAVGAFPFIWGCAFGECSAPLLLQEVLKGAIAGALAALTYWVILAKASNSGVQPTPTTGAVDARR